MVAAAIQIDSQHPDLMATQGKINQLEEALSQKQMGQAQQQAQSEEELALQRQQAKLARAKQITDLVADANKDLQ